MNTSPETLTARDPNETQRIAAELVERAGTPAVFALHGDLGSGKTCFVGGIALALGIQRPVTSPTFTLVNEYPGPVPLYHIDLYRITTPDEALALGLDDYLEADGVTAIEWAERAHALLPARTVHVRFSCVEDPGHRQIVIQLPGG